MGMSNTNSKELMLSQRSSDEEERVALTRCKMHVPHHRSFIFKQHVGGVAKVFVVFNRKGLLGLNSTSTVRPRMTRLISNHYCTPTAAKGAERTVREG
jgi:hypothetical protein